MEAVPSPTESATSLSVIKDTGRLKSIDALRGFDMLWIIGAASLVHVMEKQMAGNAVTRFLATQLSHVEWEGFHFYDLIFPLFLFIVGVSIVFSLDKTLARGSRWSPVRRIVQRFVILHLLGIFYLGGIAERWPNVQLLGVLQLIAACYLLGALLYCAFHTRLKILGAIAGALLVGYWALLTFTPFPDIKLEKATLAQLSAKAGSSAPAAVVAVAPGTIAGSYEQGRNLSNYLDYRYLPGKKTNVYYVNQGLLSPISAVCLTLFGIFAGRLLRDERVAPRRKVQWLLLAGLAGLLVGSLWGLQFPIIKKLWTSSFILLTAGWSAVLLGLFYLVIDVWKIDRWCEPFVWIGTNPITIYIGYSIFGFAKISERLVGGDVRFFLNQQLAQGSGDLVVVLGGLALAILFLRFLYRRQIFIRI